MNKTVIDLELEIATLKVALTRAQEYGKAMTVVCSVLSAHQTQAVLLIESGALQARTMLPNKSDSPFEDGAS